MIASNSESTLRRILEISVAIQASSERPGFPLTPSPTLATPFTFPPLPNLLPALQSLGLADHATTKLVDVFRARCTQLQDFLCAQLSKMLSHATPHSHDSLRTYFHKAYTENVAKLRSDLVCSARQHCDRIRMSARSTTRKPQFNHDYVPVLEQYFVYNAYPSAADRALMARKSMMTIRQIEVWFQNHRNRARKEGRSLTRLRSNDSLPADLTLENLHEKLGCLVRSESEYCDSTYSEDESVPEGCGVPELTEEAPTSVVLMPAELATNPLVSLPTSRTSKQLVSFLDATTQKSPFHTTFPSPTWRRLPHAPPCGVHVPPAKAQIDDLIDLFARLTVREGFGKSSRSKTAPLPKNVRSSGSPSHHLGSHSCAATHAITTMLCNGRHPAFVASGIELKCAAVPQRVLSIPSSPGRAHATSSCTQPSSSTSSPTSIPSVASGPVSTMQTSSPSTVIPRRQRKPPQLPRRVPGSSPIARPSHYHPYSSASRTSSSTSGSSDWVSSGPRSSSSSSSSSSTLATPDHELVSLPTFTPFGSKSSTLSTSIDVPPPATVPCAVQAAHNQSMRSTPLSDVRLHGLLIPARATGSPHSTLSSCFSFHFGAAVPAR